LRSGCPGDAIGRAEGGDHRGLWNGEHEVGQDQQDAGRQGPGVELAEQGRRRFRVVKGRQPRNGAQDEQSAAIAMSLPDRQGSVVV
jgi:hypothetical protein